MVIFVVIASIIGLFTAAGLAAWAIEELITRL